MTNKEYIELCATQGSGIHGAYWEHIRRTCKEVKVEPIYKVLPCSDVDYIIEHAMPHIRECFKNAYEIAMLDDYFYVEGMVNVGGFPIEHAWNKTRDGRYFDATYDLLGLVVEEDYTSFFEGGKVDTARLSLESRVYGGYPNQVFKKEYRKEHPLKFVKR